MFLRTIARRAYFVAAYHLYARARLERVDTVHLLGFSLVVPPGVFHPALYFSSKILGEYLSRLPLEGKDLLDMGCGSGILSVVAAGRGAVVTATDINPQGAGATRKNAGRHNLDVRVLQGNLFAPVEPEARFDYILFNPPYYEGSPRDVPDMAWQGGSDYRILREFFVVAPRYMKPSGIILLILSSDMALPRIREIASAEGLSFECVHSKALLFEEFFIFRACKSA